MSRIWLITGASSGFGRLLAERVASDGDRVIAVARRTERLTDLASTAEGYITPVVLDLTSIQAGFALEAAVRDAGGVDVLVNNAGYGLISAIEQSDEASARAQFDINFFAALTVLRSVLPALRLSQGRIVQISSFLSQCVESGSGIYSASKSALALMSDALALEVAPSGVHVTTIHPGAFDTEFMSSAHIVAPSQAYASTVGATLSRLAELPSDLFGDPNQVVDAVLTVVAHPNPPRHLAVGRDAVQDIRASLQNQLAELDAWEDYSAGNSNLVRD